MRQEQIPYGVTDFKRIRNENYYYVDKTAFIAPMERRDSFIFFVRPRRFGKSLLIDTLRCYYDVAEKENFPKLFGDLAVGRDPTPGATDAQLAALHAEALAQLKRYAADPHLPALAGGTPVHFLCYEFKGRDLFRLEEVDPVTGVTIA